MQVFISASLGNSSGLNCYFFVEKIKVMIGKSMEFVIQYSKRAESDRQRCNAEPARAETSLTI